jgi:hypothetical protein
MMKTLLTCMMLLVILAPCAMAGWEQIGLDNKEVTTLTTAILPSTILPGPGPDTLLIAGTKADGVWTRKGSAGKFELLPDFGESEPPSFLTGIKNLYVNDSSGLLFAAGDSGLSRYPLVSMIEPRWMKITTIPITAVTDIIGLKDTLFCCTPADVYTSFDRGTSWAACSTRNFLPALGNITSFTSLAFFCGINAGSKFLGALNSWMGVMNSGDWGKTWRDVSLLPPQTEQVGPVFDLVSYAPGYRQEQRLLAATQEGLRFVQGDFDTGYWHAFDPPLKKAAPKSIHLSFFSRSYIAEYWVATDSGVFVLSNRVNPVEWVKLFDRPANCITDDKKYDPKAWFAGTDDGVWQYTEEVGVKREQARAMSASRPSAAHFFTLNGRMVSGSSRSGPATGVLLVREKGNSLLTRRVVRDND